MQTPEVLIAGLDEVGRGSWAGPVVAAAVGFHRALKLPGLKDSKLMTAKRREFIYEILIKKAHVGVGMASHEEVDQFGLLHATFKAYERALEALPVVPTKLLIDGRDKFFFAIPHQSIIRGDQKVRVISAASVVAKVTRDRLMVELAETYPNYHFEDHKGYGTRKHQARLKTFGPSPIHRISYAPLKALKCEQLEFLS